MVKRAPDTIQLDRPLKTAGEELSRELHAFFCQASPNFRKEMIVTSRISHFGWNLRWFGPFISLGIKYSGDTPPNTIRTVTIDFLRDFLLEPRNRSCLVKPRFKFKEKRHGPSKS